MLAQVVLVALCVLVALHGGWSETSKDYKAIIKSASQCEDEAYSNWDKLSLKMRKEKSIIKGNFQLHEDVAAPVAMYLKIFREQMGQRNKLLEITTDICQELQEPSSNQHFIIRAVLEGSDLPKQCPFKKGTYTLHNVTLAITGKTNCNIKDGNYIAKGFVYGQDMLKPIMCIESNIVFMFTS